MIGVSVGRAVVAPSEAWFSGFSSGSWYFLNQPEGFFLQAGVLDYVSCKLEIVGPLRLLTMHCQILLNEPSVQREEHERVQRRPVSVVTSVIEEETTEDKYVRRK